MESHKMVNLLICESGYGDGGSTAYLYTFLKHLDKETFHPIVVFTNKAEGSFIDMIEKLGIEIKHLTLKQEKISRTYSKLQLLKYIQILVCFLIDNSRSILHLLYFIKKKKIDLILLNQDVVFHEPAIVVAALSRVPCIVRKGGVGVYQLKKMWKFLSRIPVAFIASSNAEYRFHVDSGFPYKKMSVIFEGVDVDDFHPGAEGKNIRDEFGIAPDTLVVGSISRITTGKGHDDFISAASLVLKEFPQAVFIIVGDGDKSLIQQLHEQVRSLGVQDKVIFTGWRKDTADILKAIDIFVHCPNLWREGMGIATLEALASGKPVVITDNWGLSDTTQDGYNGFSISIGDKEKLAHRILALLKDTELRNRMGANSRARALELFDLRRNIKEIEDIMKEALPL
jgi:glycosyltransferase involved in cell wall biosynthesis